MDDRNRKLRLGLFVLGGLVLVLAMMFFLGLSDLFVRKAALRTYFSESVQGLTVGSAVKYRGVPIGNVTRISIRVVDKLVQVDMNIELDHFVDTNAGRAQQLDEFDRFFRTELEQGLRCRLEYAGVTGMRYIDFDYFATPGLSLPEAPIGMNNPSALYIPAVPSSFRDILNALGTSLERISRIRFEEISDGLERSLAELSGLLADPALKSTINRINDAAENLEAGSRTISRVFSEQKVNTLMDTLQTDLDGINALVKQLQEESRQAKLPESTGAFRDASRAIVNSQENINQTLEKLNRALDALSALAEYLTDDPSALINGRRKAPVEK